MFSRVGYVPISSSDATYNNERIRQSEAGMPRCLCSNCEPEVAKVLIAAQTSITNSNFDSLVTSSSIQPRDPPLMDITMSLRGGITQESWAPSSVVKLMDCKPNKANRLNPQMLQLALELRHNFDALFGDIKYFLAATNLLSHDDLWKIVKNHQFILDNHSPRYILGKQGLRW